MTRIALAFLGTVAGLAVLLSFKTHPANSGSALPAASLPSASATGAASAPTSPAPSTSTGAPPKPGSSSSASSSAGPSSASSSDGASAKRTIAGQAVQTQYGVVQVQVVVQGQQVQNASLLQLTAYDARSQEINSYAAPILVQETITAQSSQIDTVSGATYTSEGYIQSLQSALDQAGIR